MRYYFDGLINPRTSQRMDKRLGGLWRSRAGGAGYHHPVEASEVKWIKRFRRDCLNDLEHEQSKRDWKNLVNHDEVSHHD
jgi:hypothetical protein